MAYLEKNGLVIQVESCDNCGDGLTKLYMSLTPSEFRRGVQEKFQIVHLTNLEWECPDGSGLNPLSDPIMPVFIVDDYLLNLFRVGRY